jgi:hypothetical protein
MQATMNDLSQVFLGGTCGDNHWREDIVIPALLERGIAPSRIFNPVVSHWDKQAQANEDAAKAHPQCLLLFVLASPDPASADVSQVSGYSLVETVMALYDYPARTVVLFDVTGMARKTAKGLRKAQQDLCARFPEAPIFTDYSALIDCLAASLTQGQ